MRAHRGLEHDPAKGKPALWRNIKARHGMKRGRTGAKLPVCATLALRQSDETIASTMRTIERRNAAFLIFMNALTKAWPSALPRKSVM